SWPTAAAAGTASISATASPTRPRASPASRCSPPIPASLGPTSSWHVRPATEPGAAPVSSPVDLDADPPGLGRDHHVPLAASVEVDVAQQFDVAPAVLLDQVEAPLPDPFETGQSVRRLVDTERLTGDVAEA